MAINTCNNPSIWEAEVGLSLQMLMPAWATYTVPDQPGLRKILSQKQSVGMVVHSRNPICAPYPTLQKAGCCSSC